MPHVLSVSDFNVFHYICHLYYHILTRLFSFEFLWVHSRTFGYICVHLRTFGYIPVHLGTFGYIPVQAQIVVKYIYSKLPSIIDIIGM